MERIAETLKEIAFAFDSEPDIVRDSKYDLLGGKAGEIYFKLCYSSLTGKKFDLEKDLEILSGRLMDFHYISGGLSGIAGVCFLLHRARPYLPDTRNVDEFALQLKQICMKSLKECMRKGNYDLLHGATGIVHVLNCCMEDNGVFAGDYIQRLYAIYGNRENLFCMSRFNDQTGSYDFIRGYSNSSFAHGISGLIVLLSKLYKKGVEKEKTERICKNLVSLYPSFGIRKGDSLYTNVYPNTGKSTRLAWCVGDLGIANALWQAGCNLEVNDWKEQAIRIMVSCSRRCSRKENLVYDAGICHGSAGIAQLFHRFHQQTGEAVFRKAADFWVEQTLNMQKSKDGFAGFKAWQGEAGWRKEYALLEGIAGIGLMLIGISDRKLMDWDECLLMS
jgi:lantibiotic modifying enzyme